MLSDTNAPKYHTKASHAKDSARKPVFSPTKLSTSTAKKHKIRTKKKMRYNICNASRGGLKRIRTAVNGFADQCLTPRPSDHIYKSTEH